MVLRRPNSARRDQATLRNAAVARGFERCSHITRRRLDWLAGHVGLELRNVVAKYPFERSRKFPGGTSQGTGKSDLWNPSTWEADEAAADAKED
jgi:hypothetical protein